MVNASPNFWRNKQVLLTGSTGFKGSWLALWLSRMGANVTGVGLPPNSTQSLFEQANVAQTLKSHFLDIQNACAISNLIKEVEPEIIIHMAAQALVIPGYQDPITTFSTNVLGTANILNAIREVDSVKVIVAVTSDKVYKNFDCNATYHEADILGGHDPYSASKAASEIIITSFRDSYLSQLGIAVASARAGNVIGGGDWSGDRLLPDAIRSWNSNTPLVVRKPNAVRPWQHVLEPLNGYLLAEKLYEDPSLSGPFNFGPKNNEVATVREAVEFANKLYGVGGVHWKDVDDGPHEAQYLSLDSTKAFKVLSHAPRWGLKEGIARTMSWYRQHADGMSAFLLCDKDITAFIGPQSDRL